MTKTPHIIRAFFAIDLPDVIKQNVSGMIQQMQHIYQRTNVRWVHPEHLHITLQFLAEARDADIPALIRHAHDILKTKKSFPVTLNEIELFPTEYKPRVISIKVEPQAILADLAKNLGNAISLSGYETEKREFRGHLTLGRIRESRHPVTLEAYQHPPVPSFRANTIILYRSEPTYEGSHYSILEKFYLNP